jgi:hyperosmotically inducible protein
VKHWSERKIQALREDSMKRFTSPALALAILLGGTGASWSQQDSSASQNVPADNTKVNQRDRDQAQPTADQQKENKPDRQIAQQIRQSIVKDKSLSTYAHNVKIVTVNGSVTLNGVVRSEDERGAIEMKAANIAGKDKVTNDLKVAPSDK